MIQSAVKGQSQIMFRRQGIALRSDERVYCGESNAIHVEVYVSGTSPSATITVMGSNERGGNYLALPDLNAIQIAVTSSQSFDVVVGQMWATVELSSLTGGNFTIWMTPYVAAGQPRVSASISVATLAAIQANLGAVHIDDVIDISTNGGIFQGTGTFASPTTGLRMWNSGGIGRIAGYNGGTIQWYADTDGRLYAGAGNVILDANAISVGSPAAQSGYVRISNDQAIVWRNGDNTADIEAIKVDSSNRVAIGSTLFLSNQAVTGVFSIAQNTAAAWSLDENGNLILGGSITLAAASNIALSIATGTKLGTATGQKLGFWNADPVTQRSAVADASGGATIDAEARTAINALLSRVRTIGLIAT